MTKHARPAGIAAFAGSALVAAALLAGTAGCTPQSSLSITADGVSVTDANGTQVYSLPNIDFSVAAAGTITVTGTDSVLVTPDLAEIDFSIVTLGATAHEAQSMSSDVVAAVTAALLEMGVPEDAVTTNNVYLNQQYDWSKDVAEVVGYEMNVYMTVKGLSIDEAGAAIATITAAGANSINGVSYYSGSYDEEYNKALEAALALAAQKAQAIAAASGMELGALVGVTEGYDGQSYRYSSASASLYGVADEAAPAAAGGAGNFALDPGTIEIEATVTVEYELQ